MAPASLGISSSPRRCPSAAFKILVTFCIVTITLVSAVDDLSKLEPAPTSSPPATSTNASITTNADNATTKTTPTLLPPIVITNRPLLGQNGTGQRWSTVNSASQPTVVSEPISPSLAVVTARPNTQVFSPPTTAIVGIQPPPTTAVPRGIAAPKTTQPPWEDQYVNVGNVDTDKTDLSDDELRAKNFTLGHEEHHVFYNSTTLQNTETVQEYLRSFQNLTPNSMLSKSHRRAMTVRLKFQFPFYGHLIENITVATGGFIYTGDYVHSWLAATQFIAPLMANFDTSLSNDSFVKYYDNGTAFTVLWENVQLHDLAKKGGFTFSASLHKNGDIIFGYYEIPMSIASIEDKKHPVKVGLSDAYISDKTVFYTRRKTIFEYHRVNFEGMPIKSNTMIILRPEPTCNIMETCDECTQLNAFNCGWCPTLNRCSTGTDRKRNDWLLKGCEKAQVGKGGECPNPEFPVRPSLIHSSDSSKNSQAPSMDALEHGHFEEEEKGGMGTVMGVLIPFGLVFLAVGWVMYAYRNPHTKSGQFLIQYRPSQWSWRRGEARYTAATIHM